MPNDANARCVQAALQPSRDADAPASIVTYSVQDLATGLGCTPRWLTEQARQGKIPARRVAKQWRFTEQDCADIIALCSNGFRKPATESVSLATGLTQRSRHRLGVKHFLEGI